MSALRELSSWLREFDAMGNAVQDQFHDLVNGGSIEDQNSNALAMIEEWLEHAPDLGDSVNVEIQDLVQQLEEDGADEEEAEAGEDEYEEFGQQNPSNKSIDEAVKRLLE